MLSFSHEVFYEVAKQLSFSKAAETGWLALQSYKNSKIKKEKTAINNFICLQAVVATLQRYYALTNKPPKHDGDLPALKKLKATDSFCSID